MAVQHRSLALFQKLPILRISSSSCRLNSATLSISCLFRTHRRSFSNSQITVNAKPTSVTATIDPQKIDEDVLRLLKTAGAPSSSRKSEYIREAQLQIGSTEMVLKQATEDRMALSALTRLAAIYHTHGMLSDADAAYRDLIARLGRGVSPPPSPDPGSFPTSLLQLKWDSLRIALIVCDYGTLLENSGKTDAAEEQFLLAARHLMLPMPLPFYSSLEYFKARTADNDALSPLPLAKQSVEERRQLALYNSGQRARNLVVANLAMLRERAADHEKSTPLHRHVFFDSMFGFDGERDAAPRWDLPTVLSLVWKPPVFELEQPIEIADGFLRSSTLMGQDHRSLVSPLYRLAMACLRMSAFASAEEAIRRVINIETILSGPASTPVATALGLLSRVYFISNRGNEALATIEKAYNMKKDLLSNMHFHTAFLGIELAFAQLRQGMAVEAYDSLAHATGLLQGFTKDHPWRLRLETIGLMELREKLKKELPSFIEHVMEQVPAGQREQIARMAREHAAKATQ